MKFVAYLTIVILVGLRPQTVPDLEHGIVGFLVLGVSLRPATQLANFLSE